MNILTFVQRKANLPTLWMGVGTVMAGTAAAVVRGNMELLPAILCLIFTIFAQLTGNFYHAYYELRKEHERIFAKESFIDDNDDTERGNPFLVRVLREASMASFLISATTGMALLTLAGQWLWFMVMGIFVYGQFLVLHYGPRPLINSPVAMLVTFLLFGPLGVMSVSLIQSQREAIGSIWSFFDTAPSLYIGPACGLMALTVHYLFSYANYIVSPDYNKRSLTRAVGKRGVEVLTLLNGIVMFALMIVMVFVLRVPHPLLCVVPAFVGCALNTHIAIQLPKANVMQIRHLFMLSVANVALTFGLTFLFFWFVAPPDDSFMMLF